MTESEFETLAGDALAALERAFEAAVPDADVQTKGSGVLEIEFEDGSKMVINRHGAAREIWVAARVGRVPFPPRRERVARHARRRRTVCRGLQTCVAAGRHAGAC